MQMHVASNICLVTLIHVYIHSYIHTYTCTDGYGDDIRHDWWLSIFHTLSHRQDAHTYEERRLMESIVKLVTTNENAYRTQLSGNHNNHIYIYICVCVCVCVFVHSCIYFLFGCFDNY